MSYLWKITEKKNNKMRLHLIGTLWVIFLLSKLCAQDAYEVSDKRYGPDPFLFNGKKYTFHLPPGTEGHQFFRSPEFTAGVVYIGETAYPAERLNYDVYHQDILLKYGNDAGAEGIISLSKEIIGGFCLGESVFRLDSMPGAERTIFQVIEGGGLVILMRWKKTFRLDMAYGSDHYVFSPAERESYLLRAESYHPYGNRKTFLAAFDPDHQPEIRKYLKSNRINLKKATDRSLTDLLTYCGGLNK